MTPDERARHKAELAEMAAAVEQELEALKGQDPFWFYQPTQNTLSDLQRAFLRGIPPPRGHSRPSR